MAAPRKLTPKQEQFVREYLIDLNATQAAIRAGYSAKMAGKLGPALIGNPRIAEAVQQKLADREKRSSITADWVLKRIAEEASVSEDTTANSRVQALKLLAEHLALMPKGKQPPSEGKVLDLSDDDLPD